jgi:two-component system CheB/CheR fusion protein
LNEWDVHLPESDIWVVGIGASAGGLEALTQFVAALPIESRACYVVAQHLAPHAKSLMVELLSKHSAIPVDVVKSGADLQVGRILIVPPNHDVEIRGRKLHLIKAGDETRPKPSVDRFFTSLGREMGSRAIGVILSGTGSDGAEGTRAVKEAGGLVIAQEESSAKYSGMPNSALETGQVDWVFSAPEIARKIGQIMVGARDFSAETPSGAEPDESDPKFPEVINLIRRELGNDFTQYKMPTIKRRLAKRMAAAGADTVGEYYRKLKSDGGELRALAQDFLVSVTTFFRDTEAFNALVPRLHAYLDRKADDEEIRCWSAGCATGEEPYSLAMLICDHLASSGKRHPVKIFATDLDAEAISKARTAVYSERDIQNLPAGFAEKYFDRRGELLEVKKFLRDMVVLARQDLIQSPPFVKLDLIICRNVLIYFEPKLQQKIFELFSYALKPGGLLFLGKSETVAGVADLFEPLDKRAKIYVKKATAVRKVPEVARGPVVPFEVTSMRRRPSVLPTPAQVAQGQMLARYGLAGAVVDGDGGIQTIVGDVSAFLRIPTGLDAFKLQGLLPKNSAVEFQLLLKKAAKTKALQISRAFRAGDAAESGELFRIQVSPLESREASSSLSPALFLVSFDRLEAQHAVAERTVPVDGDLMLRAVELEQELAATKEHLQTVIEELGVTNEELQSTNEELSSTNEELQSTNEELETTNEEFQATNEELTTLNEELNSKTLELRAAVTDLENIQVSLNIPLLVVDEQLRLQRYNPASTELFDISLHDIGRQMTRISCRCEIDNFGQVLKSVIESGRMAEATVEAYRSVYQMRITPRRSEDKIVGAVILFFNNTELIQLEKRWRKSERRARGIINGTSSLVFLKDMTGKYLAANEAFLKFFGKKEEEVIGRTDREIFPEDLANTLRNGDLEAVLKRSRIERQELFQSGPARGDFLVSRFPLSDEDGAGPYAIGTVAVDISEQIRAQEALRKSETLYRGVVEDQSVFVVRFDQKGNIVFANAAFVRYFGGRTEEYIGKPFSTVIDPGDRAFVSDELAKLSQSKQIVQAEHRHSRFGGSPRWIRWINKAVLDQDGRIQEVQAVGLDVTEYRQQTDQMVQREMLFSNIFTYTTDFLTVFRLTAQGELLLESFNRSVEEGGGYTYAQFLGRNVRELVTSQHRNEILAKYKACVESKTPQNFDEELSLQGGIKYLATTIIPVLNAAGQVERVVALSRDISKYKIAEAELNAAKAAAEIANESKSDFLASMSHELRSPLNVVIGMAELLEESSLGAEQREQVKGIQRSGKVLLTLIEDILDLSKIEAGKTKLEYNNFSVRELTQEVCDTFKPQAAAKGVKIVCRIADGISEQFVGDGARIRQILTNLVGNAVKFTEKGSVTVSLTAVGHPTAGRRLVRFEVKDTGIGIPEEHHSRIFKKFSQVDSGLGRRYGGTGLGLVISQRLTTLMSGQIGFESKWNEGSLFWFELPLSVTKKTHRTAKPKAEEKNPERPLSARILAVDDSPDSRMLLSMLLERLGHHSEIVDSGEEAIEAAQRGTFDLILMDVQMPGMDGYQTTMRIRKLDHPNHTLPIIALTANAMVGDSEKCFDAGMNDYITKPINVDLLRRAIAKWAAGAAGKTHARGSDADAE